MDSEKHFNRIESIRVKNRREERRLSQRLERAIDEGLRQELNAVEVEKRRLKAELDHIRSGVHHTSASHTRKVRPLNNELSMTKYQTKTRRISHVSDGKKAKVYPIPDRYVQKRRDSTQNPAPILINQTSSDEELPGLIRNEKLKTADTYETIAERRERKRMKKMYSKNEEDFKKVQERIKYFNENVGASINKVNISEAENVNAKLRKLSVKTTPPTNELLEPISNSNLVTEKNIDEQSLANLDIQNAKNSIAKRLGHYSPELNTESSKFDSLTPVRRLSRSSLSPLTEKQKLSRATEDSKEITDSSQSTKAIILQETPDTKNKASSQKNIGANNDVLNQNKKVTNKKNKKSRKTEELLAGEFETIDEFMEIYHPDGFKRTVHTMPDFADCWNEAKKAKYVRRPQDRKPEWEIELSVQEIFK